jgi:hypothetical protein
LQGLELLVTALLARNRQPPPTVAAGVPHAELAAELISLPTALLAMVCDAIVKLKVRLGADVSPVPMATLLRAEVTCGGRKCINVRCGSGRCCCRRRRSSKARR